MTDTNLKNAAKSAVGQSLADAAGEVCMRTRCQDIIPRALAGSCREAGRGRAARKACRHLLTACQTDKQGRSNCVAGCARYFPDEADAKRCESDCNRARCRVYPPYDTCVASKTLRDLIACMEAGNGRAEAEQCLRDRCGLQPQSRPLSVEQRL